MARTALCHISWGDNHWNIPVCRSTYKPSYTPAAKRVKINKYSPIICILVGTVYCLETHGTHRHITTTTILCLWKCHSAVCCIIYSTDSKGLGVSHSKKEIYAKQIVLRPTISSRKIYLSSWSVWNCRLDSSWRAGAPLKSREAATPDSRIGDPWNGRKIASCWVCYCCVLTASKGQEVPVSLPAKIIWEALKNMQPWLAGCGAQFAALPQAGQCLRPTLTAGSRSALIQETPFKDWLSFSRTISVCTNWGTALAQILHLYNWAPKAVPAPPIYFIMAVFLLWGNTWWLWSSLLSCQNDLTAFGVCVVYFV